MTNPFEQMKAELKTGIKAVAAPQLFTTPTWLAERMVDMLVADTGARVLEPSAGTGVLVDAMAHRGYKVTVCEINSELAHSLSDRVLTTFFGNFLDLRLADFDAVIMNPPFKNGSDIKHIRHALSMIKEGGELVAICADGPRQKEAFKDADLYEPLPAGTFKHAGTNVNTALIYITK